MELKVDLSSDQLRDLTSTAILQAITDQQRAALIQAALTYLLTPREGAYGRKPLSPIQEAFNLAVEGLARDLVRDELRTNPAITEQIHALIVDAVDRLMADRAAVVDRMADSLSRALLNADGR